MDDERLVLRSGAARLVCESLGQLGCYTRNGIGRERGYEGNGGDAVDGMCPGNWVWLEMGFCVAMYGGWCMRVLNCNI